ncbi:hypothetical protein ACHAWF_007141, partial [Thalassiosira exigua]
KMTGTRAESLFKSWWTA